MVGSYAEHPLPALLEAGVRVTLGSDDPPMFNTTLTHEYRVAVREMGLAPAVLVDMVLTGIAASSLPTAERELLAQKVAAVDLPTD